MFGLKMPELLLILLVLLLLFGANKLPQLGQGLGDTIKGFRKALAAKDDEVPAKGAETRSKDAAVK
jgi:sec-independent protein translocase protein TatA